MAQIITTQHVTAANAKAIADYVADIAGLRLSPRPVVALADAPIELETVSSGLVLLTATLLLELTDEQAATIKRLAEVEPDPEG